jgi:enamine deaminase RidA (YjgF/YER057c/UK114 family)
MKRPSPSVSLVEFSEYRGAGLIRYGFTDMLRTSVPGWLRCLVGAACVAALLSEAAAAAQKKKKEEEITQTLEVPPDPPSWIVAETAKLSFLAPPLTGKGLLSQQTRDALKWLLGAARGAQVVRIRAFVAGTGDLRRVQTLVSEVFSEKKLPLPVVTIVQVGALPMEGAQVQLEATLQEKRALNPIGLMFLAARGAGGEDATAPVDPLAKQAVQHLKVSLTAAGAEADDMLQVTCFASSLGGADGVRSELIAAFPKAQAVVVQAQRSPSRAQVECQGVARRRSAPASAADAQVAVALSPQLVFAGEQLAFHYEESDVRLAMQRLARTLQTAGSSWKGVIVMNVYPLSEKMGGYVRALQSEYLDKSKPPVSIFSVFQGLPSMDASVGIEVVAVPGQ